MNTNFKLKVIKYLPIKLAEKIFNSNVQINRQNHGGVHTVYMCVSVCVCECVCVCLCVCVCVCVLRITVCFIVQI